MEKVTWGILSTAKIGRKHVIPAMQLGKYSEVVAIASRNKQRAEDVAAELEIPTSYGTYEALLFDENIDAIYNPLPNHLHVPWTLKALEAGKHVLCEKPIALSAGEAQQLIDAARKHPQLKVMEAFMYRFHPQWIQAKLWVHAGKIGKLKSVNTLFSYYNDDPDNIRNKPGIGGGGLMDIGCYGISGARFLFGDEPVSVKGELEIDPELGVDRMASGVLKFKKGLATFTCSTQMSAHQNVKILGEEGSIEIPVPFNPLVDEPTILYLTVKGKTEMHQIPVSNHYTLQGDAFSKAILEDSPAPTPLDDAVANMKVIDAVFESSKS